MIKAPTACWHQELQPKGGSTCLIQLSPWASRVTDLVASVTLRNGMTMLCVTVTEFLQ